MTSSSKPSYQLTNHPIASLRELWTLTWPLMLSLMSGSIMMFVDRLYLAYYSLDAMNAIVVAGLYSFFLLVLPMAVCEMTEVFVGKLNGENSLKKLGQPVWQMLWFALFCFPLLVIASQVIAPLFLNPLELEYARIFLCFGACFLISVTLMGFFIAIGKTKYVTISTILSNCINIVLAPLLIFGMLGFPSLGMTGAALSSSISLLFQVVLLGSLFLRKSYRIRYQTTDYHFNKPLFREMLRVGLPSGFSRCVEMSVHCIFFEIMKMAGKEALTCVSTVQSFYLLMGFCIESISKSVTAIVSNLIGGNVTSFIGKALKTAFKLHSLLCVITAILCWIGIHFMLGHVVAEEDKALLQSESFLSSLKTATFLMCLFFLFDGFCWIMTGYLTAKQDTKFIFFVSTACNWLFYVVPLYLLLTYSRIDGATGWLVILFNSIIMFSLFFWRARKQLYSPEPNLSF